VGCEGGGGEPDGAGGDDNGGKADELTDGAQMCTASVENILGPYYRQGSPLRTDLLADDPTMPGIRLTIRGRVMDEDCNPIAGALLDFWQADAEGRYDNDGSFPDLPPDVYRLRGHQFTDEEGWYEVQTIVPGHYLNGEQYRPAHVHVVVWTQGLQPLVTQLYFPGDEYNDIDAFFDSALLLGVESETDVALETRFDFVLGA
jgi:protocatechuate 3,4-dioxygenase beta subunit